MGEVSLAEYFWIERVSYAEADFVEATHILDFLEPFLVQAPSGLFGDKVVEGHWLTHEAITDSMKLFSYRLSRML